MISNLIQNFWFWPIAYALLINTAAFLAYGLDKRRARKGLWRIPEKRLLWLAGLGGSVGALVGMKAFHHKTLHKKFYIGVPAMLAVQVSLVAWAIRWIH